MLIRASQVHNLMGTPRSKKEVLTETAKGYIHELIGEDLFNIRKIISNKFIDKGNQCEDISIQLCNDVLDFGFLYKNEENFSDEYFTGTPDINTDQVLMDVKTSWNYNTFPIHAKKIPTNAYFYQLQVYMHLTGKKTSYLCYCLVNTPEDLISKYDQEVHNFDHISNENKVKVFKIDYDLEVIEKMKEKIEIARKYYSEEIDLITNNKTLIDV